MTLPPIKGFLETSFLDWPGRVAAVVFLPRCNFRCPYCHNHGLVLDPDGWESWSLDGILGHLSRYRGWVDGVCVTGGEPCLHPGLSDLLSRFKDERWAVKLDTNGSRPEVVTDLLADRLLDAVAVDVKAPLEELPYRRNSGCAGDPGAVVETLRRVWAAGVSLQMRTTVHPHLLSREELIRLAQQLGGLFRGLSGQPGPPAYQFQRCRVDEVLDSELATHSPLGPEEFKAWEQSAQEAYRSACSS